MLVEIVGRGKTRLPRTFVEHHLSVFTIPGSEATKQKNRLACQPSSWGLSFPSPSLPPGSGKKTEPGN